MWLSFLLFAMRSQKSLHALPEPKQRYKIITFSDHSKFENYYL